MRNTHDNVIATVHHRRAAARDRSGSYFDYDPARRLLIAAIRVGSAPLVELPDGVDDVGRVTLCTERDPREGSYPVRAIDENTFVVSSAVYDSNLRRFRPRPLHPDLPTGSIVLADAPADVANDLRALFGAR